MKQSGFIKKWLGKETKTIFLLFIGWRIAIFIFALIGIYLLPLYSRNFLGGGFEKYTQTPLFWGWANFDGEHYLLIAQNGYLTFKQAFFPFYPLLISYLSGFSKEPSLLATTALLTSNLTFLLSLHLLWKLVALDYSKKIAFLSILVLLVFPTSFFFGAVYTESLFLCLTLGAFFAARKDRWVIAGVLGMLASATRVIGILLLPALLFEWWDKRKQGKTGLPELLFLLLIPLGLFSYMLFLKETVGDPFAFYNLQVLSGEQRSTILIPLYQVFWRYVKMLWEFQTNLAYLTIFMELLAGALGIFLLILGYFKRMRPSYLCFGFLSYLLPTLTGSFSSMPRYLTVIFPIFIVLAVFISGNRLLRFGVLTVLMVLLVIETMLFIRGYWVA